MWARSERLGREVVWVEIRIFRHVKVRRVTLLDGCSNGVREPGVWPIPRATISRDRAIDRLGFDVALQRSANLLICRAASVMFGHGANIAAVADRAVVDSPVRPTRMRSPSGRAALASRIASWIVESTRGRLSPGTENDHGSPPDCSQISACIIFGSTLSAQAAIRVTRSMKVHSDRSCTSRTGTPMSLRASGASCPIARRLDLRAVREHVLDRHCARRRIGSWPGRVNGAARDRSEDLRGSAEQA